MTKLKNKIKEAVSSVLPITCIVFLLSITITPMPVGTMLLFACGAVMLIIGMGLFSLGADMSMMLMGEGGGKKEGAVDPGKLCRQFVPAAFDLLPV